MDKKVLVVGAGGHAKVVIDCLHKMPEVTTLGLLDCDLERIGDFVLGEKILETDDYLNKISILDVFLTLGVGSTDLPVKRRSLFDALTGKWFKFINVIHPSAIISDDVKLGEGNQVFAGTVIQPGVILGNNVIINTSSSIDHDCIIGDNVHIAPGATLSGLVSIGAGSHVGIGAKIIQGIKVGEDCLIAAGSVVCEDVPSGARVCGVPAKRII
jgi:sugar O-acyltransferase (sialic acid O-acetyltransferase NeuD family)